LNGVLIFSKTKPNRERAYLRVRRLERGESKVIQRL